MREQLLTLEKKLRNDIFEFANENNNKSVGEVLDILGIKGYKFEDGIYSFMAPEIDTNDQIYMTYDGEWLIVHLLKDGKPFSIDGTHYSPTSAELIIQILFATTYSNNLVRAMMVAMDRALN